MVTISLGKSYHKKYILAGYLGLLAGTVPVQSPGSPGPGITGPGSPG